ncbi:hypothetical protein AJ80_06403 [Polytolypa hystricis UAMH7299]|uniref:Chitin-binding type-1 domain-containing protein n=1 Tax=Polytolypa hystricis (strain UAMH7299) TaxID=1447883 RepID=A0A2B7XXE1_POLH7|nr:hypothetical protein AJ80_06403 [Polytolypa hystricis UAMH7299]
MSTRPTLLCSRDVRTNLLPCLIPPAHTLTRCEPAAHQTAQRNLSLSFASEPAIIPTDDLSAGRSRPHMTPLGVQGACKPQSNEGEGSRHEYLVGINIFNASHTLDTKNKQSHLQTLPKPNEPNECDEGFNAAFNYKLTDNGLCGSSHGNVMCGDSHWGSCCSPYGFCGHTSSHCGPGCQSGPCTGRPTAISFLTLPKRSELKRNHGKFKVVGQSGVPVMAAAVMSSGQVIFIDKIENYTQLVLDTGQFAYSAEYDPRYNYAIGLPYKTNAFCSGGTFLADGRLVSIGGNGPLDFDPTVFDGFKGIRYLYRPFMEHSWIGVPWDEPGHELSTRRWYASVQTMPDGTVFVVSGSLNALDPTNPINNNPTYELLDENGYPHGESYLLPLLQRNQPYYMYPFLHLLNDGNVFIFVARSAEIFDVSIGATVHILPDLPGDYRTYPNTGGSVLLPLKPEKWWDPEVLVCGGGSFQDIRSPTDPTCGRIRPLAENATWEMDIMPKGRTMLEGILLPDGTVLWINGCNRGAQGFGVAKDPILDAWIYDPDAPLGQRWSLGGQSEIPRMYHSVALLLLDGTVMIAGSNPVEQPVLKANPDNPMEAFPTEFRVEIYTPRYLLGSNISKRPHNVWLSARWLPADGRRFIVTFSILSEAKKLQVALYHGGFVTHSLHMGHRMLFLDTEGFIPGYHHQEILVTMPPDPSIAPPGPYVVYVVVDGIPSVGQPVMVES